MITQQFVMDHWPLTQVSIGDTLQSYPSRKVVRVHASEGEFVAKVNSQPPAFEEAVQRLTVFDFLTSRHFTHIPVLVKSIDGDPMVYHQGESVAVLEYVDGAPLAPTATAWRTLGQVAAKLNAIPNFPFPYGVPTSGVIQELSEQANSHPQKVQFQKYIDLLLPLLNEKKLGLIHGELNPANAMQRKNGELVIIDWDECGTGASVLEAGYPLLTVFLTEDLFFQQELAVSFYQGYYGQNQPGKTEQDLLFRAALLHALRYMQFANQQKRWNRIVYAVAHQSELLQAVF